MEEGGGGQGGSAREAGKEERERGIHKGVGSGKNRKNYITLHNIFQSESVQKPEPTLKKEKSRD